MASVNRAADDIIDLGGRIFLGAVFSGFGLGVVLTVVGYGMTSSLAVVAAGVFNAFMALYWADTTYAGNKSYLNWLIQWVIIFAMVAIGGLVAVGKLPGQFLAAQFLVPAIVAIAVFGFPAVRVFLATKLGDPYEHLLRTKKEPAQAGPSFAFVKEGDVVTLDAASKEGAANAAYNVGLAGYCMLATAGANIFGLVLGRGGWLLIPIAVACGALGMIALTFRDDLSFLAQAKGSEGRHLASGMDSVKVLAYAGGTVAACILLLLLALAMA